MFDVLLRSAADLPCPADVDDGELVELIRAWERVAAWAAAGQLAVVAELARRRPRSWPDAPGRPVGAGDPLVPQISEFAVDELAAALRLSRPAAGARLHVAVELGRLSATRAALADGEIDLPKARAVVDAVTVLDAPLAAAVEQHILPRAGRQTVGQVRAALSRAVLAADPAAAETRHERAVAGRQVTLQPARDGMAELWALLPADAAVAVYQRVDEMARRPGADDTRGRDARRADALVMAVLSPGTAGLAGASSPAAAGRAVVGATVHVTIPAETALGLGSLPAELAGYGPVPASMGRRLAAAGGPWRKVTVSAVTGAVQDVGRTAYSPSAALAHLVRTRDRTCRFPGCRHPARRCDLDHTTPWPAGPTTADNLAALCRHHHRLKHQTSWTVRAGPDAELEWTSPTGHAYTTTPP
ncbi:MAG: DUF222 domain-containing protein [Mycobacteriales bacterium]